MTLPLLFILARLLLALWFAIFSVLLTIEFSRAFVTDYGWPWRRRPGSNGRAALDLRVTVYTGIFALIAILSVPATVVSMTNPDTVRITPLTVCLLGLSLVLDVLVFDFWRLSHAARRLR